MIDALLSRDLLPDSLIRMGIRRLLRQRLQEETPSYDEAAYVADLKSRPLAEQTQAANEQHYEVPTEFFVHCLGPRMKYSSCLYQTGGETLAQAEEAMLTLYAERAQLQNGQRILELGCGWGSLSLWMAERFPLSEIIGVSNSRTQKAYIDAQAQRRGLNNLRIVTSDINQFETFSEHFDRVVSVEMFEHLKNYELLMQRIHSWLKPGGLLFVHIFTHRTLSYHFVPKDATDWMSRYFFSGGQMPSDALLTRFGPLSLANQWEVNGTHYQRTAEHWLQNMDRNRAQIWPILETTYGKPNARRWWAYWRVFYMACAELWGFRDGNEWHVTHYLFAKAR
ncbi:MAG: cyclopropane-fatty-acyl-phospholipid synthase family protein [Opitutaceae bacterium]|nr:cyclopropane-fatty-acyl-phospholipid synthase family protein [Opitutaceae bacterium]